MSENLGSLRYVGKLCTCSNVCTFDHILNSKDMGGAIRPAISIKYRNIRADLKMIHTFELLNITALMRRDKRRHYISNQLFVAKHRLIAFLIRSIFVTRIVTLEYRNVDVPRFFFMTKWVPSSENVSSVIFEQVRLKSACSATESS